MTLILQIAILTVLGLTLIEDLRHRAIRWWLPPVLFVLLFLNTWLSGSFELIEVLYNMAFTTIVLGLTILYFRLRGVDTSSFFAKKFGIGDVLFLLAISPAVPFRWFPMVFVGGLIASILVSIYPIHSGRWKTIPLAGLLSVWIAGVFCYSIIQKPVPVATTSTSTHPADAGLLSVTWDKSSYQHTYYVSLSLPRFARSFAKAQSKTSGRQTRKIVNLSSAESRNAGEGGPIVSRKS